MHSFNIVTFQTSLLEIFETDTGLYDETLEKLTKITTEMFYHNEFRNKKPPSVKKPVRSWWRASRENYQIIFEEICSLIEENVDDVTSFHININNTMTHSGRFMTEKHPILC